MRPIYADKWLNWKKQTEKYLVMRMKMKPAEMKMRRKMVRTMRMKKVATNEGRVCRSIVLLNN
ncbi:unnamed protein product [Echinostoma caproni]|uniref:Ovule protein n=1 Tax=Echinostoma caproni TaxID=27848 RepID=A0A183A324_9TREM|nr:unnamed protein product [Echinostoma caproni]